MKKYLLDTNICIYLLKGLFDLNQKIETVGIENCFISEITIAELKYGIENSMQSAKNRAALQKIQERFAIIPIFSILDEYAKQKARLKKQGKLLDDFDLLIGATAVANDWVLVTRNVSDFDRLENIIIEDWTS